MPHLTLAFLGTFQVTRNGQPVPRFRVNAARALLAYLAVEADRPHRRETLAGLLWPEVPDATALKYLRHTLSELRKAIGDDDHTAFLQITRSTLQFNLDRSIWVDVAAFMRGAQSHTLSDLEQAAELYRGPFLEGFSLEGSPAFEEWLLVRQQQLARLAVDVLYRAATQRAESGDYGKAITHAQHLVLIEPLHEAALRLLMQLFALDGQRNEALAQYETYRRTLAQELNVRPSPELTAEYDRIRAGLWVSHLRSEPPESASPLRTFVAREHELAQLDRALARVRRGHGHLVFVQEVDVISDQVVLMANGMVVAEGKIRKVRDEIQEHPSQFIVRCRDGDASGVAALLFGEEHITEIKLNDDRMGMLVLTRDREQFARALGRIALDGHRIDSVVPADENVDALYEYLIGDKS